jgi:hypothetical protein
VTKTFDEPLNYVGLHGRPARCDLQVFEIGRGQLETRTAVVIFSEPTDGYISLSVTNGAEKIATETVGSKLVDFCPATRIMWIEYYPATVRWRRDKECFDLVTFDWKEERAHRPVWHRVTREWVEALIGEPVR